MVVIDDVEESLISAIIQRIGHIIQAPHLVGLIGDRHPNSTLIELVEEGESVDQREIVWLNMEEAIKRASHEETKKLLELVRDNTLPEIK